MSYCFYKICKYGKFIGIAGIVGAVIDKPLLSLLSFFWLLFIGELAAELPMIIGGFKQLAGIKRIQKKYGDDLPSIDSYECKNSYSLPFEGDWTAVNGGVTEEFSHSWGVLPQRYAYDFLVLDENGRSYSGNQRSPESYYCFGRPVLAPADGVVAEISDRSKETLIISPDKFFTRAKHIAGNYIILKHENDEYSVLAHLKNGSITVKEGDAVKRGQAIALCGNTGNSSEPHLHFQLQAGRDFYGSAGLPLRFASIHIKPQPNYGCFEPRPVLPPEQLEAGRVTRGYAVGNEQSEECK